ncbi:hypothetical protein [Vulcanococcus limneticus]|uniref:hypothetical protein n=1 Tax=Vulcanococcus limneticus TaxID=2170428 RepID=UPI00398C0F28
MADRLDTRRVRKQLQELPADAGRWSHADACLAGENWAAAVDQLQALAAELQKSQRALQALAVKVNKRHWTPLLAQPEGEP